MLLTNPSARCASDTSRTYDIWLQGGVHDIVSVAEASLKESGLSC